jgi:phosphoenolpyruvate carboxylase
VDPLSLLQIALLRRRRAAAGGVPDEEGASAGRELERHALVTTLSGVAQGLRNTG